jgi:hypothetical protein
VDNVGNEPLPLLFLGVQPHYRAAIGSPQTQQKRIPLMQFLVIVNDRNQIVPTFQPFSSGQTAFFAKTTAPLNVARLHLRHHIGLKTPSFDGK